MLIDGMGKMMEELAPSSVNVLRPSRPARSKGLNQRVYTQMRRDFMVAGPFVLHSETPELLAATWSLVRETLFVGQVDRGSKETVAWAVSKANQCPFCVDAHFAAVRAANNQEDNLAAWAEATANSNSPLLSSPPFTESFAEYLGTAVAFHYLNRMVSVFLDKKIMPLPNMLDGLTSAMAKMMMGGMVRKSNHLIAGDSLELLPSHDDSLAWNPDWAASTAHVAGALAGWSSIVESVARTHFTDNFMSVTGSQIDNWIGDPVSADAQIYTAVRDVLDGAELLCAELALCVVHTPYKVTDSMLEATLKELESKQALLALVSWSAQRAARRCGDWSAVAAKL